MGDKRAVAWARKNIGYILLGLGAAALLFVGAFAIYNGLGSQQTYKVHKAKATQDAYDRARVQVQRDCGPLLPPRQEQCEQQVQNSYESNRREIDDLQAQRITANWTSLMGVAAIGGTTFGIIGVTLVLLTFMEQRRTARIELRAYLVLQPIEMEEIVQGEGPVKFVIPVENTGSTPANDFCLHWAWRVTNEVPSSEFYDTYLGPYRTWTGEHSFGPKQTKKVNAEIPLEEPYREMVIAGVQRLFFFGDIVYKDAFGDHRKTEFFYCYNPKIPNRMGQVSVRNRIT